MLSAAQIDFLIRETGLNAETIEFWKGDFRDVYALCSGIEFAELEFKESHDNRYNAYRLNTAQDIQAAIAPIWESERMTCL
jgi:hypothetical protein